MEIGQGWCFIGQKELAAHEVAKRLNIDTGLGQSRSDQRFVHRLALCSVGYALDIDVPHQRAIAIGVRHRHDLHHAGPILRDGGLQPG